VAPAALTVAEQNSSQDLANQLKSEGWTPGLCYLAAGADQS